MSDTVEIIDFPFGDQYEETYGFSVPHRCPNEPLWPQSLSEAGRLPPADWAGATATVISLIRTAYRLGNTDGPYMRIYAWRGQCQYCGHKVESWAWQEVDGSQ